MEATIMVVGIVFYLLTECQMCPKVLRTVWRAWHKAVLISNFAKGSILDLRVDP